MAWNSSMPDQLWGASDPSTEIDPTVGASSPLDAGGGLWASVQGSVGQLLDAYTNIEVAKINSRALPAAGQPVGYQRVPGTNQVVPAGSLIGGGGLGMSSMLLIGGGLLLAVLLLRKG